MFEADVTDVNGIGAIGGLGIEPAGGAIPLTGTNDPLTGGMSPEVLAVSTLGAENYDNLILGAGQSATGPPIEANAPTIAETISEAVEVAIAHLSDFAADPNFEAKMHVAFGDNWDQETVEDLKEDWIEGQINLPPVEVILSEKINGASGAFAGATNTIYLSRELLVGNVDTPGVVADVLLEEFGHYTDSRINVVDAVGDEGDIFSVVVQGKELGQPQIEILRGEDDTAVVVIDGETLKIEKDDETEYLGTLSGVTGRSDYVGNGDSNDYYRFQIANRSQLNLGLSGLTGDIDVELLSENGSLINGSYSSNSSSDEESINQALEPGVYYVKVYPYEIASSSYYLSLSVDPLGGVAETNSSSGDGWVSYTVQPGDSLSQIALNTTGDANRYWDIANYNGIGDPNDINAYDVIWVPGNNSTATTVEVTTGNNDEWVRYTVQPGDSLSQIALNTTGDANRYWDIANYNGIDNPNDINAYDVIWVPGNNSTGTTVEATSEGGSETSYGGGVEFIQGFAEPHTREVDIAPTTQLVEQDWPDSYNITLDRIDGQGYIQNDLETWIVIHGFNHSAGTVTPLASAIEAYDNAKQVITLDWNGMAGTGLDNYLDLFDAAIWIEEVAEATVEQLNQWGFDRNNINVVGHSLGAYVAYEISERLGGVNNLVALDPALSTQGGYPIEEVDFSDYSQWSWGLHSSNFGNENITRTARESFKIGFGFTNPFESHDAVRQVWEYMLENPTGEISQYFGLEDMSGYGKPWSIDNSGFGSDWEAEIAARDVFGFGSENSYWVPDVLWSEDTYLREVTTVA